MARSKKEGVLLKLLAAKNALTLTIITLEEELKPYTPEQIRENPILFRRSQALAEQRLALDEIFKLDGTLKRKQKARLILARCEGFLKEGFECDYKIRASMGTLMRGVPNCPDPMCNRKGKPLTVEIKDEEIDSQVEESIATEIERIEAKQKALEEERKLEQNFMSEEDKEFFERAGSSDWTSDLTTKGIKK
jgi:hypothetical protein